MSRTTLDIDDPILDEVKRLRDEEGRSVGQVVSHLLGEALSRRRSEETPRRLDWKAQTMRAGVDLTATALSTASAVTSRGSGTVSRRSVRASPLV